jgi:hypothetical protein
MFMNGDVVYRVRKEQQRDQLRQVERWRVQRQAGLVSSIQLKRSACWLLCQVGRTLVALGQQLEQYGQPALVAQER